ncbi:MAG: polysaccharide deacetylase [Paenibacillaceae bacterium]|uniref:Polysaccharide deacetylase n=1 Tax=Paenibacillus mellifer TaxID=2937794 RepID=A0A9X2BRG7_9BACL|nr:polysaccharide deacetylase [Paenibacillus mellifer]MBW4838093.1 polysaccharide deacetylase [Paenibacillaceae bacterium]MCK8488912.1 polysaccharide deacetylase [Paenibacillus mellifer]
MKQKRKFGLMLVRMMLLTLVLIAAVGAPLGFQPQGMPEVKAHPMKEQAAVGSATHKVNLAAPQKVQTVNNSTNGAAATAGALASAKPKKKLEASQVTKKKAPGKTVYLTFDDGPSPHTDQVLEILQQEEVTATFFVLGQQAKRYPEVIRRIVDGGHALGNHTYNHDYDALYDSFGHFWKQVKATEEVLREITGTRTPLVRAPGGTYGHFDKTYFNLLEQGGYKVFDWNVDSGDSKRKGVPANEIVSHVKKEKPQDQVIVLMHDGGGHEETVKALPEIIHYYKKLGYAFSTLSAEQKPVQFTLDPGIGKKNRPIPSAEWVASNVVPNAALFEPEIPLTVEAGNVQMRLAAGEYVMQDGQYLAPVRTVMERLGADVYWSEATQSAFIEWGDSSVIADTQRGVLTAKRKDGSDVEWEVKFERKAQALWIPLRPLLEALNHPIVEAVSTATERRVTAQ